MASQDKILARQMDACAAIGSYLEGRELMVDTHMEQIVAGTAARAKETFSLLLASGADVPYVMAQAGHSDPKMTSASTPPG
jgi:hypothetical protein